MVTIAQMNLIRDIIRSPDGPGLLPQNHIRILPVDVHGNAGHTFYFTQRIHQFLLLRKCLSVNDQADHQFL